MSLTYELGTLELKQKVRRGYLRPLHEWYVGNGVTIWLAKELNGPIWVIRDLQGVAVTASRVPAALPTTEELLS